ncbi:MAG: hypothetical protein ACXV8U_20035, partial [Methylobacter sp.]
TGSLQLHASDFVKLMGNINDFVELMGDIQDIVAKFLVQQISVPVHGWLDLSITAALACCLFLLASYLFKPFRAEERMRLSRLLNNKPM